MRHTTVSVLLLTTILVALTCLLPGTAFAAPDMEIPSLFWNDEAWYKDAVAPLVMRGDIACIPAELCGMFDSISVSTPRDDNLLIQNTATGAYASVLFESQTAAVNGQILTQVEVFRDGTTYYLDVSLAAQAVGLMSETILQPDGGYSLRLYDENRRLTAEQLYASYLPESDDLPDGNGYDEEETADGHLSYDGRVKHIYLLCCTSEEDVLFSARDALEEAGLRYTWFLNGREDAETVIAAAAKGEYGAALPKEEVTLELLSAVGDATEKLTRKRTHLTLSTGDPETDEALRAAGWCPLEPDFTVNGASTPDLLLPKILEAVGARGSCTLYLEDCWNSTRMAELLCEIHYENYQTANLAVPTSPDA